MYFITLHVIGSDSIPMVVASLMDGVADRWMSIGLLLGIPYKLIQVFQMEDTLEESIIKMVDAWVKKQYDTNTFGEPSWRKLVEAVAARSGGSHHRLASTIASNHPLSYSTGKLLATLCTYMYSAVLAPTGDLFQNLFFFALAGLQPLASEQQIPQFEDTRKNVVMYELFDFNYLLFQLRQWPLPAISLPLVRYYNISHSILTCSLFV